jgi:TIR domain
VKTDAFISHASADAAFAERLKKCLTADGLTTWIDNSNINFGGLLRNQIQSGIRDSRVLVLVWSESAFQSRWVMAEMFTAFLLGRFIIPCVVDKTPLPQFLGNAAYLSCQRDKDRIGQRLCRAVRDAPSEPNEPAPVIAGRDAPVERLIAQVAQAQYGVLSLIKTKFAEAAEANRQVGAILDNLRKLAPLHPMVLNLSGFQCKNDYLFEHWDAIMVGRAPKDPLLDRGERYFFESLCVCPTDESAINGLGSILFYQRELDAAEFFQRRALDIHFKRTGKVYEAAKRDLEMVLECKRKQEQEAALSRSLLGPGFAGLIAATGRS